MGLINKCVDLICVKVSSVNVSPATLRKSERKVKY